MERVRKSNGNSFSEGNSCSTEDPRRPVPTWKFGVSPESFIADRGNM